MYEEAYANARNPNLIRYKGFVFNKDNTITVYGDANYPMDQPQLASLLCPASWWRRQLRRHRPLGDPGSGEGHRHGRQRLQDRYVYNSNGDFTEVDLLSQKCVADIRAKLQEFITQERVPTALKGFVTPAQAVDDYKLAIAFIDQHGHAYISNGGFILDTYDAANKTGVMIANRDPSYPYARGTGPRQLATRFARIDAINVPAYKKGSTMTVGLTISDVAYPVNTAKAAAKANVKVTLVGDKETSYTGHW